MAKDKPKDKGDKSRKLKLLIGSLEKKYGAGTIMRGGTHIAGVEFLSTGISTLDDSLGGGLPRGRIIELYGAEGSGKTTTTLQAIASCQKTYFEDKKRNGVAAFIDAEHALDPVWAENVGVDLEELLVNQPESGNQALKLAEDLAKSGEIDLVVIDSVAGLVPQEELDGEMDDVQVGAQARMMSKAMRILKTAFQRTNTAAVFINQLREKIGVKFGNPETTPGGRALKFYASVRMDIRRASAVKEGEKNVGMKAKVKVVKNKVAPPYRSCEYDIYFGVPMGTDGLVIYGADRIAALFDTALSMDLLDKSGSWFAFGEERVGLGRPKSIAALHGNAALASKIAEAVQARLQETKEANLRTVSDDEFDEVIESLDDPDED